MKKYLSLLLASIAICPLFSQESTEETKEEKLVAFHEVSSEEVASEEVVSEEVASEEETKEPAIEEKMADLDSEEEEEETKE